MILFELFTHKSMINGINNSNDFMKKHLKHQINLTKFN